ncbi:MAG: DUF3180 domain-containing protein [Propioniciclava sp.]
MTASPRLAPTRWYQVAAALIVGFVMVWLVLWTVQNQGGSVPLIGPIAWVAVVLITAGVVWLARRTRRELRSGPGVLTARIAVTRAVLGRTSILAAAALAGAYLAVIALMIPMWPAPFAQQRILHASLAVLACLGWGSAGWRLEWACRIPPSDTPSGDGDRKTG